MPTVHVIGNAFLIVLFAVLGWRLARSRNGAILGILISGGVAFIALIIAIRPDIIVMFVPYRDLTFYDNLYPLAGALFFPCVWWFVKTRGQRVRMVLWCGLLFVLSLQPYSYHLAKQAPSFGTNIDKDGVCRQTSDYNCSAASIVTLLHTYGVECTEDQAIELARTKWGKGTEGLGLYRALRHFEDQKPLFGCKTRLTHLSLEQLLQSTEPAIILVGLPSRGNAPNAAAYGRQNDWMPGFYHDVVFIGLDPDDNNRTLIADPDMGIESWPIADLRFLFRGQAVMYEPR